MRTDPGTGPVFDHLERLSRGPGVYEHALLDQPRPEHGYCVDDAARALVVVCREPDPSPRLVSLAARYLDFVLAALAPDGSCRNRMGSDGGWTDEPSVGDWWGRAAWGLGTAAATGPTPALRAAALDGFRMVAQQRSPHLRATVFAALGAGEVLLREPDEHPARRLLTDVVAAIGPPVGGDGAWPWPEARLTYANACLPEALLLAGAALPDEAAVARGLDLLAFLLRVETRDGHLSVTPVGGRGPGETGPAFDQQGIEVAALADACARAAAVTGDVGWLVGVRRARAWFLGDNDSGTPMTDPLTGAGFDGLERTGRNANRGAESTLAALATAQHAPAPELLR
jgi:hypothetical protein